MRCLHLSHFVIESYIDLFVRAILLFDDKSVYERLETLTRHASAVHPTR